MIYLDHEEASVYILFLKYFSRDYILSSIEKKPHIYNMYVIQSLSLVMSVMVSFRLLFCH